MFLFFIARVFTVQIVFTKAQTDDLIFQIQMFVIVRRGGRRRARAGHSAADWKRVLSLPWDCGLGAVLSFLLLFFFVTLETRHQRLDWPCRVRPHYSASIGRCKIHSKALPYKFPWCCCSHFYCYSCKKKKKKRRRKTKSSRGKKDSYTMENMLY